MLYGAHVLHTHGFALLPGICLETCVQRTELSKSELPSLPRLRLGVVLHLSGGEADAAVVMQTLMYQNEDLMTVLRLLCILSHTQVCMLFLLLNPTSCDSHPAPYII